MKSKNWYRLDNAAKLYPAIVNYRRSCVFALSMILSEEIDGEKLNEAVNVILERVPIFKTKLKKGIFWYYLEVNNKSFVVEKNDPYFLRSIQYADNNDYLFRIIYHKNKITMSIFHALTDGTGALEVLKAIVFEYLKIVGHTDLKNENKIKSEFEPFSLNLIDDKFEKIGIKKGKPKKLPNSFKTDGTAFNYDGVGLTTGKIKISDLKKLTKEKDVTITQYIAGIYMYYINQAFMLDSKLKTKILSILIPVNLRKLYKLLSLKNFALFVRPIIDFSKPMSIDDCILKVKKDMQEMMKKENLELNISSYVKTEKNIFLKIVPLFIKDIAMKIAYKFVGDNLSASSFSNLGIVDLPNSMKKYVLDVNFILGTSYTNKTNISAISYNDYLYLTFSREIVETELEKDFFTYLVSQGIDVEIYSNFWEAKL